MDKDDLKSTWQEAHKSDPIIIYDKERIQKTINMNHCKAISKILSDVKSKVLVYTMFLIIYGGLMLYALVYLGLDLSIYSLVPLIFAGLFLLIQTTSEIIRFSVLKKSADTMSVKESLLFFRRKLNRIRTIDFLSYLIFLYLAAILIIYNYLTDIGGVKNFSWGTETIPVSLLGILILMLLLIPWLIKYQHNQRYNKIYSGLNSSARILNGES
jgi:hypothetical protein